MTDMTNLHQRSYDDLNKMVAERLTYINDTSMRVDAVRREVKTLYAEIDKIIRGERTRDALPVESPEDWATPPETVEKVAEAANVDLTEAVGKKIEEVREQIGDPVGPDSFGGEDFPSGGGR